MNLRKKTIRQKRLFKSQSTRFGQKMALAEKYGEKHDISPLDLLANMQTHVRGGGSFESFWRYQSPFVDVLNGLLRENNKPPIKFDEIRAYYRRAQGTYQKGRQPKGQ